MRLGLVRGAAGAQARAFARAAGAVTVLLLAGRMASLTEAVILQVQKASGLTDGGTSVTATYPATPTEGNVLIAIAGNRDARPDPTVPPGWNLVISGANNTPGQNIYYKIATASEGTAVTIGPYSSSTRLGLQIYEYSGLDAADPVDTSNMNSGSGTAVSTGSVSTSVAESLLIAGVVLNAQGTFSAWTNSFVEQFDFSNSGTAGSRSSYAGADRIVAATGSYSTSATASASGNWRAQIVAFKAPVPTLQLPLYLKGSTYPSAPLSETAPTETVLPNYDPARDADPGLLIAKGGSGAGESDPAKYQIWVSDTRGVNLFGDLSLLFWSAIKEFGTGEPGRVDAFLLDCDSGGGSCSTIDSAYLELADWSGGSPTWQSRIISFGTVSYSVAAGRTLAVKVIVHDSSGSDLMFAYDTQGYPSRLLYGVRNITGRIFEDANFAGTASAYDGPGGDLALPNVDVELYTGAGGYLSSAVTDINGQFTLQAPGNGTYYVRARSATIGDADTPPAGGLNATVPGTWPYPLPDMTWGNGAARYGGAVTTTDDTSTPDNGGIGDTWVQVTVAGAGVSGVDLGFAFNLIVHVLDDTLVDNIRSRQGGLRQFLKNANAIGTAGGTTANSSQFRMMATTANGADGADRWWRFGLLAAPPALADGGTTLDGSTQTANVGDTNSRGPEIEIYKNGAGIFPALSVTSADNRIHGIVANQFLGLNSGGIHVQGAGATGNRITGCYLGVNAVGEARLDNYFGIRVDTGASGTVIGGSNPGEGNLVSGNSSTGVSIDTAGAGTVVRGNRIGTNRTGDAPLGNASGVYVRYTSAIVVGGTGPGEGNLISGNTVNGIQLLSTTVIIQGNRIGVNLDGTGKLPNGGAGILGGSGVPVPAGNATVGGSVSGAGNIIAGNGAEGIFIQGSEIGWIIRGNTIGAGPLGTETDLGNTGDGIRLSGDPVGTRIGGENPAEGNLIAHSGGPGVNFFTESSDVEIVGNVIHDNAAEGIHVRSDLVTIAKNVIHDNGAGGFDGILLQDVAGDGKIYQNTIHGNGGDGIEVIGTNHILRNNVFTGNGGYGINVNGGTMAESYNDVTGAATNPPNALGRSNVALDATDLDVDPLYVNAPADDFRLNECSSPVINAALDLGADQPDMNGSSPGLYNGPAPDMGALETVCIAVGIAISGVVFEDADFAGTASDWDGGATDVPLPNVDVELYDASDVFLRTTLTDAAGRFTFPGVGDGDYKVRVRSATVGDGDTPPAGGLNATVPATWPYPLPELAWARTAALYGGQSAIVDDTATGDDAGPGDTWVAVTVSGASVLDVDFGFAYNLIVHTDDDSNAGNVRSKQGSLRQFLKNANAIGAAGSTTANTSQFRMQVAANQSDGGQSWWRIAPLGALPALADSATVLDGLTQTVNGGDTNALGPEIEIHGASAGSADGLAVTSANNGISGLVVNGFTSLGFNGIVVRGASATNNRITGCYVGTNALGTVRVSNGYGIRVDTGAAGTSIGGSNPGEGNLLSGNSSYGIYLLSAGAGTIVRGNRIGTNAAGDAEIASGRGVYSQTSSGLVVGGPGPSEGNLISGNTTGIEVSSAGSVTIQGNRIGTNLAVTAPLGNGSRGIYLRGTVGTAVIGGSGSGEGNIISGNGGAGIQVVADNVNLTVFGNKIGTGLTGTESGFGNGDSGISIGTTALPRTIVLGGLGPGEGNVVANNEDGIVLNGGGATVAGNTIRDNAVYSLLSASPGAVIVGNVIHDNGATGDGIELAFGDGQKIYHNTVHGSGGDGIEVRTAGNFIRNNLFTGNGGYGINLNGGTMTESHNDVTGAATNPPNALGRSNVALDATDLDADPLFVDVANDDFHLVECLSPAINAGLDLGADQPDRNGSDPGLYNGAAPDMGAYETDCLAIEIVITGIVFEDADFAGTASDWDGGVSDVPLPNADVELYSAADAFLATTLTDANGRYTFSGIPDGGYKVRVRSATLGDADTPPAGGLNATVPATWPYPLPELTWARTAPLYGGQSATVEDPATGNDAGPGDTWVAVTVSGASVLDADFGFAYNLIVHVDDDALADNLRSRQGGLRQFLKNANAIGTAGGTTANTSQFRMQVAANGSDGADSWWRIGALSSLPALADSATILDGSTQTANGGNTNSRGPEIEIHGDSAGDAEGITVTSSSNRIHGLAITGFDRASRAAVLLDGAAAAANRITGCYLGVNAVGETRARNYSGVAVKNDASGTEIGGVGEGNVISGGTYGIWVNYAGNGTVIHGNRIGTNAAGDGAVSNSSGILLGFTSFITVGGAVPGQGNLISGNSTYGIRMVSVSNVTAQGNRIGLNLAGTDRIPNVTTAIYSEGDTFDILLGGSAAGAGNLIAGNGGAGLYMFLQNRDWTIQGNTFGAGPLGTETNLGNTGSNLVISSSDIAVNIKVGGENPGEGNLVAHAGEIGIDCNTLGDGVEIVGNVIRDNAWTGLEAGSDFLTIAKNVIHDNGAGGFDGILLLATAEDGKIYQNTIHGNGGDGIEVAGTNQTIRNNVFTGNGGYGINLAGGTMTESHNDVTGAATNPPNGLGRSNVALDATDLDADPLYVDAVADDFHLTECTSPAINAGLDLGADQPDMNGADPGLYNGAAPDMGAYETDCVAAALSLSGTVFEDVNYGGGAGQDLAGSSGVPRPGARVELYDAIGDFVTFTATDAGGQYGFAGLSTGTYTVRVVNGSVTSSRTGYVAGLLPVQTFRTDATSGAAVAVTDHVGGEVPSKVDAGDGSTTLAALTTPTTTAQSIAVAALGAVSIAGLDFGFHFDTVVNRNDSGQGSLRQLLENANALTNTGLAQSGRPAGIENAIFMLADGTARPGMNVGYASQFVAGIATIEPLSALPPVTDPAILDAQTQPGWVLAPIVELKGISAGAVEGIEIESGGSTVRGFVINDFARSGILLRTGGGNTIQGNYIGTDATGAGASPNVRSFVANCGGIRVEDSAGNAIGGDAPSARNVVSGNNVDGIIVSGASSSGNLIRGNYIGPDASGSAAIPNLEDGLWIDGAGGNTIGGSSPGEGNVISGNGWNGVWIGFAASTGNRFLGNRIGTDAAGTAAIPNGRDGVAIRSAANENFVGGVNPGEGNRIAWNTLDGVSIATENTIENAILGNSIFGNGNLGIDLDDDGVSPNDGAKDPGWSNSEMDSPVFTSAALLGDFLTVAGYVGSAPGQALFAGSRVEVFESDDDASGYGEGPTFLGFLTADASGNFNGTLDGSGLGLAVGDTISGTATDTDDNSSEFGANFGVTQGFSIVKRAFLASDGSALTSGWSVPRGTLVKFLLYINNLGTSGASDVSVQDVLDATFAYQAGTIKVDNSVAACAALSCTALEEAAIFAAVDAVAASTDAVDGDVASYTAGTEAIDAGDEHVANLQLDIAASRVFALLFTVRMQ